MLAEVVERSGRLNLHVKRWIRRKSQGLIDISSSLCFLTAASIRDLRAQARSGAPPDALAAAA